MGLSSWLARLRGGPTAARTVHGLPIRVAPDVPDRDPEALLETMERVVGLIARYQPQRLRRMRRDLAVVSVEPLRTHRAEFRRASRVCVLDTFFVATFPKATVAASLVHEAMHARIHAAGIVVDTPDEERACRRAELRFGLAIPGGDEVVARARGALALSDADVAPLWRPPPA